MNPRLAVVTGGFDDVRSRQVRFLQEAAKLGELTVLLWPDAAIIETTGKSPKFPLAERVYVLNALRYVSRVIVAPLPVEPDKLSDSPDLRADLWVDLESPHNPARSAWAQTRSIEYRVLTSAQLAGFPVLEPNPGAPGRKKIVATGCYDWFHSGHVRFFEEVSAYGDLYVVVGHDSNIRLLKGEGHPLLPEHERQYMVGSVRYVKQALISTGEGWLDADPEIRRLQPDIYAVNDDGDRGGKREYCQKLGLEYLVLKRTPAPGLPTRSSTDLRGF